MKLAILVVALGAVVSATSARADTSLLDQKNAPSQENTFYNLSFTPTDPEVVLTVSGYDVPATEDLTHNSLSAEGATANLLGSAWDIGPMSDTTYQQEYPDGTNVSAIEFGNYTEGDYDSFSQSLQLIVGETYNYSFLFSAPDESGDEFGEGNGLRVTVSNAIADTPVTVSSAPEPSSWALMLGGAGAMGLALRSRRRRPKLNRVVA